MAIPSPKLYRSASANVNGYHQIKAKMRSLSGHNNSGGGGSGAYLSAFNQNQAPIADDLIDDPHSQNHAFISFSENSNSNSTRFGAGLQVSRPRVPDILMINKYYGLIPQKFTISSRTLPNSANARNGSSRAAKTNCARPRAKSSTHVNNHNRTAPARGTKGCRSENDSPDPIKMVLGSKGGSMDLDQDVNFSLIHFDKPDPFGPVTKKMSVEKYKKWKASGAGKNFRSLSLFNNELPESKSCHAKRRNSGGGGMSTEAHLETRRVIKIDLNTVSSWDRDEENHYHHHQSTKSSNNGLRPELDSDMQTKNMTREEHQRQRNNLLYRDKEEKSICSVNNAINNHKEKEEEACPNEKDKMDGRTSLNESLSEDSKCASDIANDKDDDKSSELEFRKCDDDNGVGRRPMRAISLEESVSSWRSDSSSTSKRRPTTASVSINSSVFRTPNNFNPPSKVIPWTQRESAGGKPLTLAERRAKFQRAPSIHSSSSLSIQSSMELGEEEGISISTTEEQESVSGSLRVPSVAFRESRKPLHVTQPPEIPTLISQNNPNADEDIQIEIEKVAIMLRKTQSLRHFSRSLDSGIEAERGMLSDSTDDVRKSSCSNIFGNDTEKVLSKSGSESSLTSEDSSSSVGGEGKDKLQSLSSSSSSSKTVAGTGKKSLCSPTAIANDKGKVTSATDGPVISRQYSANGSNSVKSSISSQSGNKATDSGGARLRRPPLKKAVSISCEQELLRADAKRNEVNSSNVNENNGKSLGLTSRPKTAQAQPQRNSIYGTTTGTGTRSTHSNYSQATRNNVSQSHQLGASGTSNNNAGSGSGGSQGLRNRKILIKKALLEINQSSACLRRKWGTLGRPRTAPSSEKNAAQTKQHPSNNAERRKPMKASPFPISSGGRMANSTSGSIKSTGGSGNLKSGSGEMLETRSNSEGPEEPDQRENEETNSKKAQRSPFRQSFSLDEGTLLGYSKRSVGEGRIPIFERMSEEGLDRVDGGDGHVSVNILNDEISFLSSKKREQCLKVYEKMMKTGCSIKLDTIFRGMLTPSEYRAFMRAAEKATQEEAEQEEENEELEREIILQS